MQVTEQQTKDFLEPWADAWAAFVEGRRRGEAWPWVQECMRTRDEQAALRGEESERLPVPDLPHLRTLTWAWYACRLLEIDKARQMMVTWMGCGLIVHGAMFTPSAREGYQNMTMADTGEKLDRYMLYILKNQPLELMLPWVEERGHPPKEWVEVVAAEFGLSLQPTNEPRADQPATFGSDAYLLAKQLTNKYRTSSGPEGVELIYLYPFFDPTERLIEGIPAGPKGPNKWRGGTRTGANHDEAWFQQALEDNLNSAGKSVGDYGFHRLWSTASLGEDGDAYPLQAIERDPVQPKEFGGFNGAPILTADQMPEGMEIWRTKSGYTHLRIHHYADPNKRGEDWIQRNVYTGQVRKNRREVLIQYNAPSGQPFYDSFNYERQRLKDRPRERGEAQLILFMDGGRRPASGALLAYPDGRVSVVLELVTPPMGKSTNVTAHATALRGFLNRHPLTAGWWQRDHVLIHDPSMADTRGETDDKTSVDILIELGFNPIKGAMDAATRYESLTNLNLRTIPGDGLPALLIDQGACPNLFEALSGACTVAKNAEKTGSLVKTKDHFSHIVDALEYSASYLEGTAAYRTPKKGSFLRTHRAAR